VCTQVTAAALEHSHTGWQTQGGRQSRNVPTEQLILQGFRRGRNEDTRSTEQSRNQVGIRLANTRARLNDQDTAILKRSRDGLRHRHLSSPRRVILNGTRQRTIQIKHAPYSVSQCHGSSWLVGVDLAFYPGNFITQGQAPLLQAAHHQFINRGIAGCTVDQRIQIGVLHTQFDQMPLRGMEICYQRKSVKVRV
jgi:hypothetical protein